MVHTGVMDDETPDVGIPGGDGLWPTVRAKETERNRRWAATMAGHPDDGVTFAHRDSRAAIGVDGPSAGFDRGAREDLEGAQLAPGATHASGAGNRARPEEPDPWRTCFERDRDRILHAPSFRRLAGKTQVFVFPDDHQRTRLTHALEVAQVAVGIARACRLNVALTEAIALGHDCGHGPGGHASEDALTPFVDRRLRSRPLGCGRVAGIAQSLRGDPRRHPQPLVVPAGTVDAGGGGGQLGRPDRLRLPRLRGRCRSGIVTPAALPPIVLERCGDRRGRQLGTFIDSMVATVLQTGRIGMADADAEALAAFRASNYEHIYLRPSSLAQGQAVVAVLQALVEHFGDRPHLIPRSGPDDLGLRAGEPGAVRRAVAYVAGMTDRFAFTQAVAHLGWDPAKLPVGIGVSGRI